MIENPFSLSGKTILVTGASSGIGRAIAIACTQMGASVILTGRNVQRLNETLTGLMGEGHQAIPADLTDGDQVEALVSQLPKLDGVSHNAGISLRVPCNSIENDDYQAVMKANFEAPMSLQTALLSHKRMNRDASIVFMASKAADFPSVGNALYSASKGALISYAKVLALELAPRNIRVNCVCPAMVLTPLVACDALIGQDDVADLQKKYPLKRYGQPDDVAYLAVYLLSNVSTWMTGVSVDITGGAKEL